MAGPLMILLIGSLLQGSNSNVFQANLTETVQVMTGSCVTVPCSFDVEDKYEQNLNNQCTAIWRSTTTGDVAQLTDRNPQTGDLTKKNCTTTFSNMQTGPTKDYYFRIDCANLLKYSYSSTYVKIEVTDNFPSPTLTKSTLKIKEGESVSLTCSAPAPCLPHPPTLIWTPKLGDIQETLQENQDKTKFKTSVMNFTASHLHHEQNISCTAVYKKQDGSSDAALVTSLIPDVLYSPKNVTVSVSPSGSVLENSNVTLTCNSDANPAEQNYTWYGADGGHETVFGTGKILNITVSMNRKSFVCKAENDVGEQHSNITHIDVLFRPQILLSSNCTKTANQLKCSCETVGNPTPMTHWFLNGQPVSQSSQMVTNELLDGLHLRSIITVNEPQYRDLSTLLCFSSNSLGSASKTIFVSWLESSRENQGLILALVLITRVTGFVFLVFAVLYLVWFHKTHHKARGIGGDVNTDAYQMKEKNKVPNSIKDVLYANSAALTQAENHQPGTGIKCTNSSLENVEETRECSGKKTEHLVHVSVN